MRQYVVGGAADTGGGRSLAVVTVAAMLLLIGGAGGALPAERLGKMTNLIVCYADWGQCDGKVLTGAQQGCNVLVWFAINIRLNATAGGPWITGGPDPDCVAAVAQDLWRAGLDTLHLVSVGGWDQPHPDTSRPASEVWETFKGWNQGVVARPHLGVSICPRVPAPRRARACGPLPRARRRTRCGARTFACAPRARSCVHPELVRVCTYALHPWHAVPRLGKAKGRCQTARTDVRRSR